MDVALDRGNEGSKMLDLFLVKSTLFLFCLFFSGQALAAKAQPEESIYVANFKYTLVSEAAPSSIAVAVAIIDNPTYIFSGKEIWVNAPQFENLTKALKTDLSKLFGAKGMIIKGPYDSYEKIAYPDKKGIDMYLVPTMELFITSMGPTEPLPKWVVGMVKVKGKVTLELRELNTKELMWSKSIELNELKFPAESISWGEGVKVDMIHEVVEKPVSVKAVAIMNKAAKEVERQYPEIMAGFFKLIDPQEISLLKKDCQDLKSKKGY